MLKHEETAKSQRAVRRVTKNEAKARSRKVVRRLQMHEVLKSMLEGVTSSAEKREGSKPSDETWHKKGNNQHSVHLEGGLPNPNAREGNKSSTKARRTAVKQAKVRPDQGQHETTSSKYA